VVEGATAEATAERSAADTEAVVGATVITDHTAVARATAVAASLDMVAVAAAVAAPTVVAMAHKLLEVTEATEAVRNRLLLLLRQSQLSPPPPLMPLSRPSNSS
jgi:hypothetical protein